MYSRAGSIWNVGSTGVANIPEGSYPVLHVWFLLIKVVVLRYAMLRGVVVTVRRLLIAWRIFADPSHHIASPLLKFCPLFCVRIFDFSNHAVEW